MSLLIGVTLIIRKNISSQSSHSQSSRPNQKPNQPNPPSQSPPKSNKNNPSTPPTIPPSDPNQPKPTPPQQPPKPNSPNNNNNSESKVLANLIKADLQDALTNDSRWKVLGLNHFFQNYQNFWGWISATTNNEEIKKELEKNRIRNYDKRRDDDKQDNLMIFENELDCDDYNEILNLISQINSLKKQKDQQKRKEVYQKLNNQKGLIYWDGNGKRNTTDIVEKGRYYSFRAKENGQEYFLEVVVNHPILNDFSFDKEGFYLTTGTENISLEKEEIFVSKYVELGDKITFTPFNP